MAKKQIVASAFSVTAVIVALVFAKLIGLKESNICQGLMASYGTMLYYTKICYICV